MDADSVAADSTQAPRSPAGTRADGLELYEVAYDEARRHVDAQREELSGARTRAVQYLAFVGTATAFLVGSSLRGAERDALFYLLTGTATVLFFVSLVLVVEVLMAFTRQGVRLRRFAWRFNEPASRIIVFIDREVPSRVDKTELNQRLAYQYNNHWTYNNSMLDKIRVVYAASIASGLAQLALWTIVVWARGAR